MPLFMNLDFAALKHQYGIEEYLIGPDRISSPRTHLLQSKRLEIYALLFLLRYVHISLLRNVIYKSLKLRCAAHKWTCKVYNPRYIYRPRRQLSWKH